MNPIKQTPASVYMFSANRHARHMAWRQLKRQGVHWQNPARNRALPDKVTATLNNIGKLQLEVGRVAIESLRKFSDEVARVAAVLKPEIEKFDEIGL